MGTTTKQDQDFITQMISDTLLENAIEWISNNLEPEDVFSVKDLEYWAKANGYEQAD